MSTTKFDDLTLAGKMMHVLDRLAHGEDFNKVVEETGITARVAEALVREQRSSFILIQEGGTSTELYIHAHETEGEAEEDRISCSRDGAYRTSRVIELPGIVAALGEAFYEVAEELLQASHDLEAVTVPDDDDDTDEDDGDSFVEILQHRIRWHLRDNGEVEAPAELPECASEHIERLIRQGFNQGELNVTSEDGDTEFRGWWSIDQK